MVIFYGCLSCTGYLSMIFELIATVSVPFGAQLVYGRLRFWEIPQKSQLIFLNILLSRIKFRVRSEECQSKE